MRPAAVTMLAFMLAGCGEASDSPARPDTAPAAVAAPDTASAVALRDSATATLSTLLDNPATATFDSVIVVQPPREGERVPAMAVCGRIGGKPGIKGSTGPVRFVFQSKWALYVEEPDNREQFAQVWANLCAVAGGTVVVGS